MVVADAQVQREPPRDRPAVLEIRAVIAVQRDRLALLHARFLLQKAPAVVEDARLGGVAVVPGLHLKRNSAPEHEAVVADRPAVADPPIAMATARFEAPL